MLHITMGDRLKPYTCIRKDRVGLLYFTASTAGTREVKGSSIVIELGIKNLSAPQRIIQCNIVDKAYVMNV